jgi:hypothetical protein
MREKGVRHMAKQDADGKEKSGAGPAFGPPATVRTKNPATPQTKAACKRSGFAATVRTSEISVMER